MVRVLLFTGSGGAGTTTLAAATAVQAAASGRKTLLLSAGGTDSVGDICRTQIAAEPTEVAVGLYAARVDSQAAFEQSWPQLQALLPAFASAAAAAVDPAELVVPPGPHELLALLELRNQVDAGRWDSIVVDCGPTEHALRMLAAPATLLWYVQRLLSLPRRRIRRESGAPDEAREAMPAARAFAAATSLHTTLHDVAELLAGDATSTRLVLAARAGAAAAGRRALSGLALHGVAVDGVTVTGAPNDAAYQDLVAALRPADVSRGVALGDEPLGTDALIELARLSFGDTDVLAPAAAPTHLQVDPTDAGFVLSVALPFAGRDDVQLARRGDDLVVTVHGSRRVLSLPSALRRCLVRGATLTDGRLCVDFAPDPSVWLRS